MLRIYVYPCAHWQPNPKRLPVTNNVVYYKLAELIKIKTILLLIILVIYSNKLTGEQTSTYLEICSMSTKSTQTTDDRQKNAFIEKLLEIIHKQGEKKQSESREGKPS